MLRTTAYLGMGRPKIWCTKIKLCTRLGERLKLRKNEKNSDFIDF